MASIPHFYCEPMPCGPTMQSAVLSFELDIPGESYVTYHTGTGTRVFTTTVQEVTTAPYIFEFTIPDPLNSTVEPGDLVYYTIYYRSTDSDATWNVKAEASFMLAPYPDEGMPFSFTVCGDSSRVVGEMSSVIFKQYYRQRFGLTEATLTDYRDVFHVHTGNVLRSMVTPAGYYRAARGTEGYSTRSRGLPVMLVLGDHEADTTALAADTRQAYWPIGSLVNNQYQQTATVDEDWEQRYYYWTWDRALFVVLDDRTYDGAGATDAESGWIMSPAQRTWLAKVVEAHRKYPFKFIFSHSALFDPDPDHPTTALASTANAKNRAWLLDLFDRQGVTAFVHGQYSGWSTYQDGDGIWHVCAAGGAALGSPSTGDSSEIVTWNAAHKFVRIAVGWDAVKGGSHPGAASLLVVDAIDGSTDQTTVMRTSDNTPATRTVIPKLDMITCNHAGDSQENPIVEGFKVRATIAKQDADETVKSAWVSAGGLGEVGGATWQKDVTDQSVETDEAVTIDLVAGVDLRAEDPAVLNVLHVATTNGHFMAGVYVLALPTDKVTLDGYNGVNESEPLVIPVHMT